MIDNFSSAIGNDLMEDEGLIDHLFIDEVVELFYLSDSFIENRLDFGGGISGITCRSVLVACKTEDGKYDARILAKHLGLVKRKTIAQQDLVMCENIIKECQNQIKTSAYIL